MKKGQSKAIILGVAILVIAGIILATLQKTEESGRSRILQSNAEIVSRDLSNLVNVLDTMEQGVQLYKITFDTYEISMNATHVTAMDKNVLCEEGCSWTYKHNGNYVQKSHIVPGKSKLCVVKKYRDDGLPIIYLCDNEGRDLRCNCQIDILNKGEKKDRIDLRNSQCKLTLKSLDNYGEVGDENTVSMIVTAENCGGIEGGVYLSPFGLPKPSWKYGDKEVNDANEDEFTSLRYKITKECLEAGYSVDISSPNYCPTLKDDRNKRTITDNSPTEVTLEYMCKGEGEFRFDVEAYPADREKYAIDVIDKIQTLVGCGEELKPHTCVDGCYQDESLCEKGEYYCDREGSKFANFCAPEYYDVNCVPS